MTMSYDDALAAWQEWETSRNGRHPALELNFGNRMSAVAACITASTALITSVKRNESVRKHTQHARMFFYMFAMMAAQYPRRSVSLGIATNYPPGPCTRCGKPKCVCPPGGFKVARPTINPDWLHESIHSVQVRMRKLYHGGNMLNGGRWNVLCRFVLEVHEALDNDMLEMAVLVQRLADGQTNFLGEDPDEGRSEADIVEKSIEFGDVLLWLAVLANALDVPLANVANPEWDPTNFVFPDEVELAQGEFEMSVE